MRAIRSITAVQLLLIIQVVDLKHHLDVIENNLSSYLTGRKNVDEEQQVDDFMSKSRNICAAETERRIFLSDTTLAEDKRNFEGSPPPPLSCVSALDEWIPDWQQQQRSFRAAAHISLRAAFHTVRGTDSEGYSVALDIYIEKLLLEHTARAIVAQHLPSHPHHRPRRVLISLSISRQLDLARAVTTKFCALTINVRDGAPPFVIINVQQLLGRNIIIGKRVAMEKSPRQIFGENPLKIFSFFLPFKSMILYGRR